MDYEQDYIMRMIKDMTRMIAKLLLGKDAPQYMLPDAQPDDKGLDGDSGSFYRRLIQMADAGEINEAENLLTDYLDQGSGSKEELEVALGFYVYINEMSNDFLDDARRLTYSFRQILFFRTQRGWLRRRHTHRASCNACPSGRGTASLFHNVYNLM